MLVRLGVVVAASFAAFAVKRRKRPSGTGEPDPKTDWSEEVLNETDEDSSVIQWKDHADDEEKEEEEEEEEVKTMSNLISSALPSNADAAQLEEELLPEFESLLSGEIDFPLPETEYDVEMANNASEVERLRTLVKELEEREVKLEGELLEYYGLKEQETDFTELQKQLKMKTMEVDMLNITINSLQAERKKLQEEVAAGVSARKELEVARNKIKELQRQIQLDAGQTKGQLLLLKQQVSVLHAKEEEAARKDAELNRKLKVVKDLEVEVVELRRKSKELEHGKRELTLKLATAEAKVNDLTTMTETELVSRAREEINNLRHANEDLTKQVEGLQMNRFSEVEELVYLRWVNACLRYELRDYQNPSSKISARDLSKNLSPKSQERAKRLMLEYAGSERGQGDTDLESIPSAPSSPGGSEDFDNVSIDSYSSRYSSLSKKPTLIQKLKRWGRSRDDSSVLASPSRSMGNSSPMRTSVSQRSAKGPLESLMLRNAADYNAITTFARSENDPSEMLDDPSLPRLKTRVASSDSLNSVASSFQLMSKSVEGVADDKYPAYKDRHKLALEREKAIRDKADQARAQRFGESITKGDQRERAAALPPKLAQIKEKKAVVVTTAASGDQQPGSGDNNGNVDSPVVSKMRLAEIEKRAPRVPRPPPRSSHGTSSGSEAKSSTAAASRGIPPPPPPPGAPPPPPPPGGPPRPPPPPGSMLKGSSGGNGVHRAPELVELYQSLMKRESKKDPTSLASVASNAIADARSNMIGEIANKSTFMLAVKADVESQGEFVQSLATEVRSSSFTDIEDLVAFVNWLDEELSFLVDERAVLKHFDWPESKADALREAAFEYQDLMKLEKQVTSFVDDPNLACEPALKKMYKLLEKMEQSVYALLRTRDMAMSRYKEFGIPVDWLSDSGVVGKIKLSSVQLARKYMKRVSSELDALAGTEKEPNREFLLLQGVRFAFRVHQFAGGFDAESMRAFEELRSRANSKAQSTAEAEKNEA